MADTVDTFNDDYIPTWNDILNLTFTDMIVDRAIRYFKLGHVDAMQALMLMVWALVKDRKRLLEELRKAETVRAIVIKLKGTDAELQRAVDRLRSGAIQNVVINATVDLDEPWICLREIRTGLLCNTINNATATDCEVCGRQKGG